MQAIEIPQFKIKAEKEDETKELLEKKAPEVHVKTSKRQKTKK